jgi:hypothetical protein
MKFARFKQAERLLQQRELFDDAFSENRGAPSASVEHYRWKFHEAPSDPTSYEYEATEDGRMLGYYAAIPYPYQLGERKLLAGMVCDVMTHSEARGKGVFTELGQFALAEMEKASLDFVTGYPIRPEVMGGHLRAGWEVAFELPMYLKPLRANAIMKSKGMPFLVSLANIGVGAYTWALARRPYGRQYTSKAGPPHELLHCDRFEAFLERWSNSVRNHLRKSTAFYDWRLSAPGTEYQVFFVLRDEEIVAAAIGREADLYGIPSFALVDVMVASGEEAALRTLYADIERQARTTTAEAIVMIMSRYQARRHRLRRSGFLKSPFTFKLILRSVSAAVTVEAISDEADWHLMWIDSDDL